MSFMPPHRANFVLSESEHICVIPVDHSDRGSRQ